MICTSGLILGLFIGILELNSTVGNSGDEIGPTIRFGKNVETSVGGGFSGTRNVTFDGENVTFVNEHCIVRSKLALVCSLPSDSHESFTIA